MCSVFVPASTVHTGYYEVPVSVSDGGENPQSCSANKKLENEIWKTTGFKVSWYAIDLTKSKQWCLTLV